MRPWRKNATENQVADPGTHWIGVRELRPTRAHSGIKDQSAAGEAQESGKGKASAPLTSPLTLPPLSLHGLVVRVFTCEPFPRKATSGNLAAYEVKPLRVCKLAPVVPERLFVKIAEQVKRLNADVGAVQLALYQTPEVLHRIGVDGAPRVFNGVIHNRTLVLRIETFIRLQRIAVKCRNRLEHSHAPAHEAHASVASERQRCVRCRRAQPCPAQWPYPCRPFR